jgi:hypothetical protein
MFTRLRQIWLAALVTVVTSCVALTTSYTVYNRPTGHFHPYDRYERGFLADPYGYETRNTYQPPPKTASLRTSSRGDVTVSQVHDKRYDVTAGEYASNQLLHSSKGAGVDDVAVVYRKHLKQDYGGMSGSHGGGSYGSYSSYYGNGGDDYATRNAALPRCENMLITYFEQVVYQSLERRPALVGLLSNFYS